jgi:predicted alpha-1,2-mannosidase
MNTTLKKYTLYTLVFVGVFSCKPKVEDDEKIQQEITLIENKGNFTQFVNPFIGTSNFGATHPGAIAPRGMASVSPFNVAGPQNMPLEKDSRWLSNPYVNENTFLTGFSHVNLSGVGCPELGVILTMPTVGEIKTNHLEYGTTYTNEKASPGYYSVMLDSSNVKVEATASTRVGVTRYTFPAGKGNILLNLGLGLTNEQGASVRIVSDTEIEGMRSVGSFCYNSPEQAYPVYFVAKFSKPAKTFGVWKKPYKYNGIEAQWMGYNGKTRMMKNYTKTVVGDSIGTYFSYDFNQPTKVEVKIGVSYVSIENARENLGSETRDKNFSQILTETKQAWNNVLSRVEVEGGSTDDKTIFYTALYHTQIHPNILNDVNGEYPEIATGKIGKTKGTRYTVFSLWDTYRNYHQLMSLLYPEQQINMVNSMLEMYDENGWLPKWELNSTETFTMVGDPASVVIADTYLRGLTDFDVDKAYKAMVKGATQIENNPLRPGLEEYLNNGYISVDSGLSGPVSITQEYNISDYAISQLALALGKQEDNIKFFEQSLSYRKLLDKSYNLLRPKYSNGSWYTPFNPNKGANFEKNVGYIEGNAWQYAFMNPHDVKGMITLMGGETPFVNLLDYVFNNNQYDMANEPDIAYPFLYNFSKGNEWKTQQRVHALIKTYFTNKPAGLPGNDDTGTMSAWLVYSMMGLYPVTPANPVYTLSSPKFNKITVHLNTKYYKQNKLVITSNASEENIFIDKIFINNQETDNYFLTKEILDTTQHIQFNLKNKQR